MVVAISRRLDFVIAVNGILQIKLFSEIYYVRLPLRMVYTLNIKQYCNNSSIVKCRSIISVSMVVCLSFHGGLQLTSGGRESQPFINFDGGARCG